MLDFDNLKEIWQTITRNKSRSLLTAFGVFWGIFILVVLSASGNGFQNGLMHQIEGFSTNTAFMFCQETSKPYKGYKKNRNWSMNMKDVEVLKNQIPEIKYISPMMNVWGGSENNNVFYGIKGGQYQLKGVLPEYNEIDRNKILYGRFINETDILENRKVCVIGNKVYEEMIGNGVDPLGKMLKASGIYYQIIGVIQAYSENVSIGGKISTSVILPLSTMQKAYNVGDSYYFMAITADDNTLVSKIQDRISDIIKDRHDISPEDELAFQIFNVEEEFTMFNNLFLGINILIWIVGIGTLLSGVVGVSNIMLVTVKERTREIGIRRALGAKPSVIIKQVLSESLLLTILAGIVGLCIGVAIMAVVSNIVSVNASPKMMFLDPQISFGSAILATLIVTLSGILAGVLPAMRAIQIKAIDAIREE